MNWDYKVLPFLVSLESLYPPYSDEKPEAPDGIGACSLNMDGRKWNGMTVHSAIVLYGLTTEQILRSSKYVTLNQARCGNELSTRHANLPIFLRNKTNT